MRLDDGVCSGWFAVEHGLRQGCVLAPLLFNMFVAVIDVVDTRFKADKGIMERFLVYLMYLVSEEENGDGRAGGSSRWRASPGGVALRHALR